VNRCAASCSAINAIKLSRARLSTNEARRRICFHTDATQVVREFLAPLTQVGLADIQALALLADRLDDHMDMRMRLVGMECHGVAVLERQLLATRPLRREQNLVRRRSGRHRKHQFVNQLRRPLTLHSAKSRLAFRQIEVPILDQVRGCLTVLKTLPVVGPQLDLPVPADVRQMLAHRRHRSCSGWQHLDYDFRRAATVRAICRICAGNRRSRRSGPR
jgi:hypothetical protein